MITGPTTHLTDDDLVLLFYGEHRLPAAGHAHLASCADCAKTFEEIVTTLTLVDDAPVPERDERYGLEVWQRLRPELPVRQRWPGWTWREWPAIGITAAALLLGMTTFLTGRYWRVPPIPTPAAAPAEMTGLGAEERARLAAIVDHLERSERVLVDLSNDDVASDVKEQQSSMADLVDTNRLYRDAATQAGDSTVAGVLDDLERTLLDIAHTPSTLTPAELAVVRTRLDAAALLFKVRILSNELRERETTPLAPRKTT